MKDWKKIVIDSPTMWPKTTHVDLEEPFVDDRGYIQHLVNTPMKNIALIKSVAGALRANHYHLEDWHYMYMLDGEAEYHYRAHGSDESPKVVMWRKGELVFTPPMEEHTTIFTQDSTFLAMSRNARDQETYEADVRRVELVDPNNIKL
jgi:oxalate decarboxylase/phosphoglucose isomerase-like protein (cupin superfamily)